MLHLAWKFRSRVIVNKTDKRSSLLRCGFVMAATNFIFHYPGNSVETFFSSSRNKLEWSCCKIFIAIIFYCYYYCYYCYCYYLFIRLGWKLAKLTNTLAYYCAEFVMATTNFIFHSLGNSVKTFFSSSRNKLEWSCC